MAVLVRAAEDLAIGGDGLNTTESRGVKCAIRIPANENLERDVAELLPRRVGRASHKPTVWYKSFLSKAAVGRRHGEWWQKLSIMRGSCSRASGSSRPLPAG
jgi:hypothetical protein